MRITWSEIGEDSLKSTVERIEAQWNDQTLNNFLDLLDRRLSQLKANPQIAPKSHGQSRKLIVHKHISLFYEIVANDIEILLVWDNRQDPDHLENHINK